MAYIENIDNKPCINHKDKNRSNNNISNLEWVTYRENNIHKNNFKPIQINKSSVLS